MGIGVSYTTAINETNKVSLGLDINKLLVPTPPTQGSDTAAYTQAIKDYHTKSVVSSWFSSLGDGDDAKEFTVALGAEYWYKNQFAFRAGYFSENKLKGDRRFFTLGAGLKYNTYALNFSYLLPSGSGVSRNPLSNTLRFSLMFDLGK
jgi:subtilase family serine protease